VGGKGPTVTINEKLPGWGPRLKERLVGAKEALGGRSRGGEKRKRGGKPPEFPRGTEMYWASFKHNKERKKSKSGKGVTTSGDTGKKGRRRTEILPERKRV